MPATVDIMKWFQDYVTEAENRGDRERMQLGRYVNAALQDRYANPTRGIDTLTKGIDYARRLGEPCWELLFGEWITEFYLFGTQETEKGLENAIRNFTLAHQPAYQNCLVIGRVYVSFISAHYMSDIEGYADKIRAMIDYIDENIRVDVDGAFILQRYRAYLPFAFEQWDEAEREIFKYLDACRGTPFRECDAYFLLVHIAIQKRQYEQGEQYARQLEAVANQTRMFHLSAEAVLSQALFKLYFNHPAEAAALYQKGWAMLETYPSPLTTTLYDVTCAYQEGLANRDAALKLRDQQLAAFAAAPNPQFEAHCRVQRCRLLGRMGKPIAEEIAAAYAVCHQLKTATLSLERVRRVEQGDYTDTYVIVSSPPS